MLRPTDIAGADFTVAVKPEVGYESRLYLAAEAATQPGVLEIKAANSGVYTPNNADAGQLSDVPQQLLAVVASEKADAGAQIVLVITGTDADDQAYTGTATIKVPSYSNNQDFTFPIGYAVEFIPNTAGQKCKTITSIATTCNAKAAGMRIVVSGFPDPDDFNLIGCKTKIDYNPKVAEALNIQCGRDPSAFTKPGQFLEAMLDVTAKITNRAEGLSRYNGVQCTALVKTVKEDKLTTDHTYFAGCILTAKNSSSESTDPSTLDATGKFELFAQVIAQNAA